MARAKNIGTIFAELSLRDGKFVAGLKTARIALNRFGAQAAKSSAMIGGTAAVGLGAAMVAGTKRALDQVDAMGDLSASTGVAVSDLMGLRQAYKEGGLSADKAAADINKMQDAIAGAANGDQGKIDTFKNLGLDLAKIIKLSPADQFQEIGKAIMGVDDMAQRVSLARDIFGKSGGGLLAVFDNVEEARRSLGRMPEVAEKFAGAMGRANDLIGRLPAKSDQFFVGFTGGIIGELLPALEKTNGFDFTTLGENLGKSISTAFVGLTDGMIWEVWALKGTAAIMDLGDTIFNVFESAINSAFDAITGKGGGFAENMAKWMEHISKGGGSEFGDELRRDADTIWNEMQRRRNNNSDTAAGVGSDGRSQAESIANAIKAASASRSTSTAAIEANEYQRRGLSLDAVASPQQKQAEAVDLLKKLNDGLDRVLGKLPIGAAY